MKEPDGKGIVQNSRLPERKNERNKIIKSQS